MVITSYGGHLGWCERGDGSGGLLGPWGGSTWVERVACGFLETSLGIEPSIGLPMCDVFE